MKSLLLALLSRLTLHWQLSLLVAVFLPLLLYLGNWQLSRAEVKRELLAVYQQQRELPAIPLTALDSANLNPYRSVIIRGRFDTERYWLLDNRSRAGRTGYEVIMPFLMYEQAQQQIVLVNRGWVPAPGSREQLPEFLTPEGELELQATLYGDEKNAWIKHSQNDLAQQWPKRVLQLTSAAAQQALDAAVFDYIVRIADESPAAFTTGWRIVNSGPEKHRGYAIQWFAMALALLLLFAWRLTKNE